MITIYGIPNCDTVRKTRKWFTEQSVDFLFHDFRKDGIDAAKLSQWCDAAGWEILLNRRGTTWRKLPEEDKADIDEAKAVKIMANNPSCIKRPVIEFPGATTVGFDADQWKSLI